ncbi:tetratricopeptide repeat-containing sensor histidine kinase [Tellurirhabdus bombi]|uniref:tetratricopeptide repeat-containing sensor histidine kinase n=1 Tax=Tellurirhabdus bombi TaxID=2907205 RepID=UPI001F270004|nr:ATP-binding protein [Tellurirhabdus bombi]
MALLLHVSACLFACQTTNKNADHAAYTQQLINKADSLKHTTGLKQATSFLDSAYEHFPAASVLDKYLKYRYLLQSHQQSNKPADHILSESYADSIFRLIRSQPGAMEQYQQEYALTHLYKGDVLRTQKRYKEAYSYYHKGKILMEGLLDTCQSSQYTNRIAVIYYAQADYAKATVYYKQAMQELKHCRGSSDFEYAFVYPQGTLDNIGLCYAARGMADSAMYYYNAALTFIDKNAHKFPNDKEFVATARAVILGNQAKIYQTKGDLKRAEALLKTSIRINSQKKHDNRDAQFSQAKLVEVYFQQKKFDQARLALQDLKTALDTLPNSQAKLQWTNLQWQYFDRMHDIGQSHRYLKSYLALKDTLEREKDREGSIDQTLQRLDNQHQLELFAEEEKLNRLYLLATIMLSVMALTIAFLIWKNWKRSQDNILELKALNQKVTLQNAHMQKALAALEQSHTENTHVMKVVAHDLRSPIAAINMASLLLLEHHNYTAEQREFLEMIKASTTDSMSLINNLLQTNKKADKGHKEWVEFHLLLAYCVNLLKFKADEKRQSLELQIEPVTIFVDREKIWRVLSNLIANAIKFSPTGTTINIRLTCLDNSIQVAVEDHGIGIPNELKEKVFDMFTEAKRPGTAGEQPFGLGLAISKQIVEAHQGKLWFESSPVTGTTFYVELPLTQFSPDLVATSSGENH